MKKWTPIVTLAALLMATPAFAGPAFAEGLAYTASLDIWTPRVVAGLAGETSDGNKLRPAMGVCSDSIIKVSLKGKPFAGFGALCGYGALDETAQADLSKAYEVSELLGVEANILGVRAGAVFDRAETNALNRVKVSWVANVDVLATFRYWMPKE